jgi:hypothetical protein
MEVLQTTHGEVTVKKWKMNSKTRNRKIDARKTVQKRARTFDDDYISPEDLFAKPVGRPKRRITREALICHETFNEEEEEPTGRSLLRQELDNFRAMLITSPPPLPSDVPPPGAAELDWVINFPEQQLDFFSDFDTLLVGMNSVNSVKAFY